MHVSGVMTPKRGEIVLEREIFADCTYEVGALAGCP